MEKAPRQSFLTAVVATAIGGCLQDYEYEAHAFDELTGNLDEYEGKSVSTTGYVESSDESTYFYFPDPEGEEELIQPMNGTYEVFKNAEPVSVEASLSVLDHHPEFTLPTTRDAGERTVKGRVKEIFFDENLNGSGYGILYRF